MNAAARKKILEKISALKCKTVANGCTEAEAMSAAEKIAQLMSDYDIAEDDTADDDTACKKGWAEAAEDDPVIRCATAVGYFTDTKVWVEDKGSEPVYEGNLHVGWRNLPHRVIFFGLPTDTEIGQYLFEICRAALARSSADYRRSLALFRRQIRERKLREFQWGMADSMSDQLHRMRDRRRRQADGSGRDVVPIKQAIIERDFAALGLTLRSRGKYRAAGDAAAYGDGRRAGDTVTFVEGLRHQGAGEVKALISHT